MKNAFIIVSLFLSTIASAADYYISATGNDANSGLSSSTAWKSIGKINSAFSIMKPGDRILFNRGDTFYGTLIITKSGLAGSPIIIGAYGTGDNPVVTGFTTITGWTNEGGGIYSKVITSAAQTNMVTIDGLNTGMGRYPNSTYLTYESFSTNVSITDNGLGDATDWAGAEVVIRKNDWTLDRCLITGHSGDVLSYTTIGGGTSNGTANFGYFIQNDLRCVTDYGEWYHNISTGKLYLFFGAVDPSTKIVKVSTLNNLVYNHSSSDYITINNISFKGSIENALDFHYGTDNCVVQNCSVTFAGQDGIRFSGSYGIIDNNTISDCNRTGIGTFYNGINTVITNNTITNIGIIIGLSKLITGIWSPTCGIAVEYNGSLIQYNKIENVGYIGIYLSGSVGTSTVKNNFVNNVCLNLDDGGGIYSNAPGLSRIIDGNIILNSKGNNSGTPHTYVLAEGIYLDEYAANMEITNNTIANCSASGIKLHKAHDNKIENNTSFNNGLGIYFLNSSGANIRSIVMNGNIFFAKGSTQIALEFKSVADDISSFGTADNNYYARPLDDVNVFKTYQPSTGSKFRILTGWQTFTIQDANSKKSPITITNTNDIRFEYNASKTSKEIALAQPMIDIKGAKYQSSITLLPYTSVVLMVDPNPAVPVLPVFTGAVVENSIPLIIEMSYHISLANIVPANSAFTVQVNGVNRIVNSVGISNNKVQLTLASAVAFGDIVTVSYTTPATNPLQTSVGDKAASISAKAVTNNCISTVPAYVGSVIENVTPAILEMSYDLNLANIVPAPSAFDVLVNSVSRTVISVAIAGSKVQLTLASPVVYSNTITVSYTKPSINPLQSASGGVAGNIAAKPVTNNCINPIPLYISSVVENATPSLLGITFNLSLDNIASPASSFNVQVNSVSISVNSVAIVGGKVQLTLASAIVYGDIVTVAYTSPATNPLQTASGGLVETFSAKPVTNNLISLIPVYINSVIENATPSRLEITYNPDLASIVPSASAFIVQVNSLARSVSSVAIVGDKVRLTLASAVVYGDIVTISYTSPAINPLQLPSGGLAVSFTSKSVTNNLISPVPVYISSVVENTSPAVLEMSYDLILANIVPAASAFNVQVNSVSRSVSSVAIAGAKVRLTLSSAVAYGNIITIAYTSPALNPLQIATGGVAASFTVKSVTNNLISPVPVYISSAVENSTPAILAMSYDLNLANIIPAAASFNVLVNSVSRSVSSVTIAGTKVLLTLASAVVYGDIVTVAYSSPALNPLQVASGGLATGFSAKSVNNNCISVSPAYLNSVIENIAPSILEMSYDLNLANIVPPASAFNVKINSLSRSVSSVAIAGKKVLLTLSSAVVYGDIVNISYTGPAINPLQIASGAMAANISGQPVTNNCVAVIPVYISSVINNTTPSILEMTYDLTLANSAPVSSAFNVQVNSLSRTLNSVAIVGGKVRLTLASPVVFGNLVTVSYTKPGINPLRTNAGGVAENIISQPVTNNCLDLNRPNDPPILVIKNETDSYSGFVYEIDASGSHDPDKDNLTYEWTVPANIAASSNNTSKIKFLSPVVKTAQSIEFQLKVNDGRVTQSAIIPINILPYKPELSTVRIANIEASDYQAPYNPFYLIDGNLSTKWSVDGENQWVILKLAVPFRISHLTLAFLREQMYESYFDIYASQDNIAWNPILTTFASCNFSGDYQVFDFPASENNTEYAYIKFIGHGNSVNFLNILSEFKVFGDLQQNPDSGDSRETSFIIYPNPAQYFLNISIEEPILVPDKIIIIDSSGRIVFEDSIAPGVKNIQITKSFNSGIYIVELRSGSLIIDAQKLIINK